MNFRVEKTLDAYSSVGSSVGSWKVRILSSTDNRGLPCDVSEEKNSVWTFHVHFELILCDSGLLEL